MNRRQKAHAALKHALDALGDGSGAIFWGPGVVGSKLSEVDWEAAGAFDQAAQVIVQNVRHLDPSQQDRIPFIAAMRKLAPVVLDVALDLEGDE